MIKQKRNMNMTKFLTLEQMDFLKYLEEEEIQIFSLRMQGSSDFGGKFTMDCWKIYQERVFRSN